LSGIGLVIFSLRFHRHQSSPENNESDTWKAIKIKKEISKKGILNNDLFDRVLVSDYCQLVFFFGHDCIAFRAASV